MSGKKRAKHPRTSIRPRMTAPPLLSMLMAAAAFGVSREYLRKKLMENKIEFGRGKLLSILEVHKSIIGDSDKIDFERKEIELRNAKREEQLALRESIKMSEACQYITDNFQPLREMVATKLVALASQVNPSDPNHALGILERFRDQFLKLTIKLPEK